MGDFAISMQEASEAAMTVLDAETVTYTPNGGDARSISALVQRELPIEVPGGAVVPGARLTVRNDATDGIAAGDVDTGGDTVAWSPKRGGSSRTSRIVRIAYAGSGMVVVEVA